MPMDAPTMATLRRYIAEPDESSYSDAVLNDMFDANLGDVNVTAAEVWADKAGKAATLVDTSEGASSRKMSQVFAQAQRQAAFYADAASSTAAGSTRGARTRPIERV